VKVILALAMVLTASGGMRASSTGTSVQVPGIASDDAISSITSIFCAYGGNGSWGPGIETQFAVAVLEIDARRASGSIDLSDFSIVSSDGTRTKASRLVEVDEFAKESAPQTEFRFGYYLDSDAGRPWKGTIATGKMRIRARWALVARPQGEYPMRFELNSNGRTIEGRVNGRWASS